MHVSGFTVCHYFDQCQSESELFYKPTLYNETERKYNWGTGIIN